MKALGCDMMITGRFRGARLWQSPGHRTEPSIRVVCSVRARLPWVWEVELSWPSDRHGKHVIQATGRSFVEAETAAWARIARVAPLEVIAWLRGRAETCES